METVKGSSAGGSLLRLIVCLALVQVSLQSLPEIIKIGGLFSQNDDLEMAFRYAINNINSDRYVLHSSRLQAAVETIQVPDSFHASKSACRLIERGISAIFGPKDPSISSLVRSTCKALHLPHIDIGWDYRYKPSDFTVNMHPPIGNISRAFLDFVLIKGWKAFTIIYEDNEGLVRVRDLLKAPYEAQRIGKKVKITLRKFEKENSKGMLYKDGKPSYKKFLKDISKSGATNIVLDFPVHKIPDILRDAQQVGMMTVYHNYLITSLDLHTVDLMPLQNLQTNITGFTLVDPASQEKLGDYNDWIFGEVHAENWRTSRTRPMKTENALLYDGISLYAKALDDLERTVDLAETELSCESNLTSWFGKTVIDHMKQVRMKGFTGPIKFDQDGIRQDFILEIVQLKPKGLSKIGTWSRSMGINITRNQTEEEQDARQSLQNQKIIMTTIQNSPYLMKKTNADKLEGNDRFEGFCVDLVHEISKLLNFTYEIRLSKDEKYGGLVNGEWNGMIRELIDREADIAIADISITYDREQAVDFTMPWMTLGISILFKKPTEKDPELFSFLLPFSADVWLYTVTALLGVSILLYFLARVSPNEWDNPHPCDTEPEELENQFNMANSIWFSIGTLLQQGCDILPRAVSTRTLASIWSFFVLIMVSSYTANLAAFLTAQRMTSPIEDVNDLAKQTTIHYGCVASGSTCGFFKNSKIEPYSRMWAFMESTTPSVFVDSNDKGIDRVMKGNYAFFMESTTIEYTVERKCELQQVGDKLDRKGYGIATPTGSPYRGLLSSAVIELQEGGVLHMLKERWWKQKGGGKCPKEKNAEESAKLGLANVGGVFLLLLIGTAIGCVIAVAEFMWKTMQISREDRDSVMNEMKKEILQILACRGSQRPLPKSSSTATGIDTIDPKASARGSIGTSRKESKLRASIF